MQDAKALKVSWRDGEQMTPPPDSQVNETNVHPNLLGSSALAGLAVYVVWGLISAALDKPKEWSVNVKKLIGAVGVSAVEVAAYR